MPVPVAAIRSRATTILRRRCCTRALQLRVHENPPCPLQRDAHEVLWSEMAEELAVKPRRIEESYGLESGLKESSITLDEHGRQDANECPLAACFLFP